MKTAIVTAVAAAFIIHAARSDAALGLITATAIPPGPLNVNDLFTVSLSISGYTEATQIDAYQFNITYPSALFEFVGPFDHGSSAPGPNQQWLSMPAQEAAADGYSPAGFDNGTLAGTIVIDYSDLGFSVTEGGTNTVAGFLVSFTMKAIAQGTGSFTPTAPAGGVTFLDVDFAPAGSPLFAGTSVTVVPEPGAGLLTAAAALVAGRRRRRS